MTALAATLAYAPNLSSSEQKGVSECFHQKEKPNPWNPESWAVGLGRGVGVNKNLGAGWVSLIELIIGFLERLSFDSDEYGFRLSKQIRFEFPFRHLSFSFLLYEWKRSVLLSLDRKSRLLAGFQSSVLQVVPVDHLHRVRSGWPGGLRVLCSVSELLRGYLSLLFSFLDGEGLPGEGSRFPVKESFVGLFECDRAIGEHVVNNPLRIHANHQLKGFSSKVNVYNHAYILRINSSLHKPMKLNLAKLPANLFPVSYPENPNTNKEEA